MKTVLIIEDEDEIRQMAKWVVELSGYHAIEAGNGDTGLEILAGKQVDLVLLDLRLSGHDGWFVISKIKSNEETKSIPVIIVAASAGNTTQDKAWRMGASAFLVKPVSAQLLQETIDNILQSQ